MVTGIQFGSLKHASCVLLLSVSVFKYSKSSLRFVNTYLADVFKLLSLQLRKVG